MDDADTNLIAGKLDRILYTLRLGIIEKYLQNGEVTLSDDLLAGLLKSLKSRA